MLVSGRRGVFDGVIEGLHQHWKYREVAKVITMQRLFRQVIYTAKLLEAESSGILVSVNKLKDGHAIIIYRGKNYRRPLKPVPENLLTKREALHRSLEMQRIGVSEVLVLSLIHHLLVLGVFLSIRLCHHMVSDFDLNFFFPFFVSQSLKFFAYQRQLAITDLKCKLVILIVKLIHASFYSSIYELGIIQNEASFLCFLMDHFELIYTFSIYSNMPHLFHCLFNW